MDSPTASAARCRKAGGKGRRTLSKCALAITASRSGFGKPFRFVLPSAASVNIVSISDSNWSAGRISQRNRASPSPAFQKRCGVPGATTATSRGRARSSFSPIRRPSTPSSTSKRSVWKGCTCAAATNPSGRTIVSTSSDSPLVSSEVRWKTSTSPVTGFSSVSPERIIVLLLSGDHKRVRTRRRNVVARGLDLQSDRRRTLPSTVGSSRTSGDALRAGRGEPALVGEDHRLHAVPEVELHEDALDVRLDRRLLDDEGGRDLAFREPGRDELGPLVLARGELV